MSDFVVVSSGSTIVPLGFAGGSIVLVLTLVGIVLVLFAIGAVADSYLR
jgi:hypothetical protein